MSSHDQEQLKCHEDIVTSFIFKMFSYLFVWGLCFTSDFLSLRTFLLSKGLGLTKA